MTTAPCHNASDSSLTTSSFSGRDDLVQVSVWWRAGNLVTDPEAALLFIDFSTGDTLHLSGRAETQWDAADLPGAQRAVVFQTEAWVHVKAALPIQQQGPVESSPYNPTPPASLGNLQVSAACTFAARHAAISVRGLVEGLRDSAWHCCICILALLHQVPAAVPRFGAAAAAAAAKRHQWLVHYQVASAPHAAVRMAQLAVAAVPAASESSETTLDTKCLCLCFLAFLSAAWSPSADSEAQVLSLRHLCNGAKTTVHAQPSCVCLPPAL